MVKTVRIFLLFFAFCLALPGIASATAIGFSNCGGAYDCQITNTPPNPVTKDPNDGILLVWDEVQNYTLLADLAVDRVADTSASYIKQVGSTWYIVAGTIVSSHYVQWDPGNGSSTTVTATIDFDSDIFAFITADAKLFSSDATLGLPGLNYNTFTNRGLESGDTTAFNGPSVNIQWTATSPGDWTRLITAYSPSAEVPLPGALWLFGSGLAGLALISRKLSKS